ncbi:MAG TPA: hypothetical protein VJJ83_00060 [Candidatus Babeliales bacterium]|nr:hypothetical protein [Candidatus Babeliales bacterium]
MSAGAHQQLVLLYNTIWEKNNRSWCLFVSYNKTDGCRAAREPRRGQYGIERWGNCELQIYQRS